MLAPRGRVRFTDDGRPPFPVTEFQFDNRSKTHGKTRGAAAVPNSSKPIRPKPPPASTHIIVLYFVVSRWSRVVSMNRSGRQQLSLSDLV